MSTPHIGQMVVCVMDQGHSNNHNDQPAVITKVWSEGCVNIKVFPDCGDIFDATSIRYLTNGPEPESRLGYDCWAVE